MEFIAGDNLTRLISNIINNAIEASVNSGKPIIIGISDDVKVTLTIKDNGCGISPEILQRLGEKGFTTQNLACRNGVAKL